MFSGRIGSSVKYSMIALVFFTVFFLIAGFFISRKMEEHFVEHQKEDVMRNMKIVEGVFKREMKSLSILAVDWAMWDQMYDFADNPKQEFIDGEFSDETFHEIDINLAVIVGSKKEILFSKQVGTEEESLLENSVPEETIRKMVSMWPEESPIARETVRNNVLDFGSEKILVASRQITKSDGTGEPRGMIFFGRYIEEGNIEELENVPGFQFNVFKYQPGSPEMLSAGLNEENRFSFRMENSRKAVGIKLMEGIAESNFLVLQADQAPVEQTKVIDIIYIVVLTLGACYLATLLLTVFLIGKACLFSQKKENPEPEMEQFSQEK
jgi:sensor domain CHASE-containing protein